MNEATFQYCVFNFDIGEREVEVHCRQFQNGHWLIEVMCPAEGCDILWDPFPDLNWSDCLDWAEALAKEACEAWDE